jgi:hypothetical protein
MTTASLVVVMLATALVVLHARVSSPSPFVGIKDYYLGLGDSLAFGFQPNFDFTHGYVYQWYADMRQHGSISRTDYGCNGETTATFITGGCPNADIVHDAYAGSQLAAALAFLTSHPGRVSPISLDLGANDLLADFDAATCTVGSSWEADLTRMDRNLSEIIVPDLVSALLNRRGQLTGDLVAMNYYNPFQVQCPIANRFMLVLNAHLAADWTAGWQRAGFRAPPYGLADVSAAFGGPTTPSACTYTWICSRSYHDIHATGGMTSFPYEEPGNGYGVISGAFERLTGY